MLRLCACVVCVGSSVTKTVSAILRARFRDVFPPAMLTSVIYWINFPIFYHTVLRESIIIPGLRARMIVAMVGLVCSDQLS